MFICNKTTKLYIYIYIFEFIGLHTLYRKLYVLQALLRRRIVSSGVSMSIWSISLFAKSPDPRTTCELYQYGFRDSSLQLYITPLQTRISWFKTMSIRSICSNSSNVKISRVGTVVSFEHHVLPPLPHNGTFQNNPDRKMKTILKLSFPLNETLLAYIQCHPHREFLLTETQNFGPYLDSGRNDASSKI